MILVVLIPMISIVFIYIHDIGCSYTYDIGCSYTHDIDKSGHCNDYIVLLLFVFFNPIICTSLQWHTKRCLAVEVEVHSSDPWRQLLARQEIQQSLTPSSEVRPCALPLRAPRTIPPPVMAVVNSMVPPENMVWSWSFLKLRSMCAFLLCVRLVVFFFSCCECRPSFVFCSDMSFPFFFINIMFVTVYIFCFFLNTNK